MLNQTQENESSIGKQMDRLRAEALENLLKLAENLLAQGKSTQEILEVIMP